MSKNEKVITIVLVVALCVSIAIIALRNQSSGTLDIGTPDEVSQTLEEEAQ